MVELTLIEIAQITQPDDSVGSGSKPRRLKSLFKHLTQTTAQPKKAAPQVAAAEPVAPTQKSQEPTSSSSRISSTTTSATQTNTSNPSSKAARPQLKSSVSLSWNNLRQKKSSKINVIPGTLGASDPNAGPKDEQHDFTQQDLELQWMSMCNRMPQKYSGIATRMKNMNPQITDFPNVEVLVDNQVAMDQLEQIKKSILSTLKLYLHNKSITLSVRLAEQQEHVRILSRREQFILMEKENPSIAKLKELLDLELA